MTAWDTIARIGFWIAAVVLLQIYLGYPFMVWLWARLRPRPFARGPVHGSATVIIAAHNEGARLANKIVNVMAADPAERILEVIVASDGSTDDTADVISRLRHPRVRLLAFPDRRGKASTLNDAAAQARGDFLVFTDVRQELGPDAIDRLLAGFADPQVGVISGELVFRPSEGSTATGEGVGAYWRYEKFLRHQESLAGSVPGATGAFYAVRARLFRAVRSDVVLDDVAIPMQVMAQGYRCVLECGALAFDSPSATPAQESVRKRRTIAGCFQLARLYPQWALPGGHPAWFQFVFHKVARLASPFALILLMAASLWLVRSPLYAWAAALQCVGYGAAVSAWFLPHRVRRSLGLGAVLMFVVMNWNTLRAAWDALRGRYSVRWESSEKRHVPSANR